MQRCRGSRGRCLIARTVFDEKGIIKILNVPSAHHRRIAEAEDDIGRRHPAAVLPERAHRHPVIVDPGFDPVMSALFVALGERQAGDDASRNAAITQQGDKQTTLGGASPRWSLRQSAARTEGPSMVGSFLIWKAT